MKAQARLLHKLSQSLPEGRLSATAPNTRLTPLLDVTLKIGTYEMTRPKSMHNCFVIMPISDPTEYENGHFKRVFEHLIKPACSELNMQVVRADDVKNTNFIILDILRRIISADLVICDLSSKNPNVLYELGIRQAFDLPVVLMKDSQTQRIFDIQGVRTIEYDESLRIDTVHRDRESLKKAAESTLSNHDHDGSSLIRLLSVKKAELADTAELSEGTALILDAISEVAGRVTQIEQSASSHSGPTRLSKNRNSRAMILLPIGEAVEAGSMIYDGRGALVGKLLGASNSEVFVKNQEGESVCIPSDDDLFYRLTSAPF